MASTEQDDSLTAYPITIDCSRTLDEMIQAGNYHSILITSRQFQVEGTGTVEREAFLVHLDYNGAVDAGDAEAEITKRGLRPATVEELLAFGEAYPDIPDHFSVIALGSFCEKHGERAVPLLKGGSTERYVISEGYNYFWSPRDRFLAVRK